MKRTSTFAYGWALSAIALIGLLLTVVGLAEAQSPGNNAVYNSSNGVTFSLSFIDASVFIGNGNNQSSNICGAIYGILSGAFYNYPATGAIIDARGISGPTALTCPTGRTPWNNGTTTVNVPSTILLPPTGANPIVIPTTWVLPSKTRLVGEGENNPVSSTPGTTIQAPSGTLLSTMIQFGSSSVCSSGVCSGISVERLTLDGQAQAVHGIVNQFSQNNTYVDHVTIYQILGTGLLISSTSGSSASNSGPYTNITFDTGIYSGTTSTVCAQILNVSNNLTGTKGIHGLRCKSETQDAPAAVLLDASNNSIEDVNIVGFYDGILVGSQASAQSNVLLNIVGDTAAGDLAPVNVVHISGNEPVSDLSIVGVTNVVGSASGENSIKDDVTSTTLGDTHVAIYALGESPSSGGGYSRFTTSRNAVHWTVGTSAPTTTSPTCSRGSLYSCTNTSGTVNCSNGTSNAALWVCVPSGSTTVWSAIK
jgi:hypothetical protein